MNCFDAVYVLTYMFSGTVLCNYFNYFGIGYEKASVMQAEDGWHMIPYDPAIDIEFRLKCSRLIHVCDHERLNSLLQTKTALSTNWYDRHSKGEKELLKVLKNTKQLSSLSGSSNRSFGRFFSVWVIDL